MWAGLVPSGLLVSFIALTGLPFPLFIAGVLPYRALVNVLVCFIVSE